MSNMYSFINKTWNPLAGECPHACSYCYVKSFRQPALIEKYSGEPRLYSHELKNLGSKHFYFVCSCIDLFACSEDLISKVLKHCRQNPDNKYLFQTKNPKRIHDFIHSMPFDTVIGTTIESNRWHSEMGKAPYPAQRCHDIASLSISAFPVMITVEPIMDFDMPDLFEFIKNCYPELVNIGADSKGHKLPEPSADKINSLIIELRHHGIQVKIKSNLKRITG